MKYEYEHLLAYLSSLGYSLNELNNLSFQDTRELLLYVGDMLRLIKYGIMKINIEVKVGDTFKNYRPIHGEMTHKCIRIKKKVLGTDDFYVSWLVDENNIMIKPSEVTEVII